MGVHQSPLPEIKAAEWGYTVLNLPTGQTDGAGRVIDNIYLITRLLSMIERQLWKRLCDL